MPRPDQPIGTAPAPDRRRSAPIAGAVVLLLGIHLALAITSLLGENPTVDEVAHLPAGVSYWQRGTFRLYHHNPPLVKLAAALPVVLSGPTTAPLYELKAWGAGSQATFGEFFALLNAPRYLDLMNRGRLVIPLFGVIGGLAVFSWSRRLYGDGGGLLSLTLWALCPNVLAHGRLVTTDVAAASLAAGATLLFSRYLDAPSWRRAALAGLALGLAELTKFSLVLLFALGPMIAAARLALLWPGLAALTPRRVARSLGQGGVILLVSVLVIDLGYGFEGVGQPLGRFEFGSRSLTVPRPAGQAVPSSDNQLLAGAWAYRVNRFRGTILDGLPVPLPRHYVLGFDEQRIETEGIPRYYLDPGAPRDDSLRTGYSVYLDGDLRRTGWWYFYLATLAYKVPEGTIVLVGLGGLALIARRRSRREWADEVAVLLFPVAVLGAISLATDICLGLRYILPIFPFVFVATGKVVPWLDGLSRRGRRAMIAVIVGCLGMNVASVAPIHPHYLAYFNRIAGGPDHGSAHLIDSNLDWGQDLVPLARWLRLNHPGRPVGLAYFGQINPTLLKLTGDGRLGFDWFLPPMVGTVRAMQADPSRLIGPARRLTPGLYAISASIARGLPWRFYDSASLVAPERAWQAAWNADEKVYDYFAMFEPVARIGHSIFVYDLTAEDCARWTARFARPSVGE